ncbi:hypothetical protein I4U23_027481 [Adineta vaga]|nr:hypothetical protein I4U23_027481 [Adineta vaga]
MSLEEIGRTEIVKLLLEKGACRSISNNYKCLPYDEAKSNEIKELFLRRSNRFSDEDSGHIDWMKYDATAEQLAKDYRYRQSGLEWISKNIQHHLKYIKDEMPHTEQERISTFLNQVQQDPYYLLRTYTIESTFESLAFKGNIYHGMPVAQEDLKEYTVGNKIMNKVFMSTTSDRKTKNGDLVKLSTLCSFEIVNHRTGLNIETISEYRNEKEVLVGPYTAFSIIAVRRIAPNYAEIDLG